MSRWDAILASAPLNREAAVVTGQGDGSQLAFVRRFHHDVNRLAADGAIFPGVVTALAHIQQ